MSIKSDKWIQKMCSLDPVERAMVALPTGMSRLDGPMIEPFEAGQVKEIDGKKIVSYGTSSYGYDVRCADEFKIFTNIPSTLIRSSKRRGISVLSRQIHLPLRARLNVSASHGMC